MWLYLDVLFFTEVIKVKIEIMRVAMIQNNQCPYKRGRLELRDRHA